MRIGNKNIILASPSTFETFCQQVAGSGSSAVVAVPCAFEKIQEIGRCIAEAEQNLYVGYTPEAKTAVTELTQMVEALKGFFLVTSLGKVNITSKELLQASSPTELVTTAMRLKTNAIAATILLQPNKTFSKVSAVVVSMLKAVEAPLRRGWKGTEYEAQLMSNVLVSRLSEKEGIIRVFLKPEKEEEFQQTLINEANALIRPQEMDETEFEQRKAWRSKLLQCAAIIATFAAEHTLGFVEATQPTDTNSLPEWITNTDKCKALLQNRSVATQKRKREEDDEVAPVPTKKTKND